VKYGKCADIISYEASRIQEPFKDITEEVVDQKIVHFKTNFSAGHPSKEASKS
jgi:hypothetical protein